MSTYREDQLNGMIDRGLRLLALSRQLEDIKTQSKNDEMRAMAAILQVLVTEIKTMLVFNPKNKS